MNKSPLVCGNDFMYTFARHTYNVYQIMYAYTLPYLNLHNLVMLIIVYGNI